MDEPGRLATPFMLGHKIHCLAVAEWKGRSWLACGVRRKSEVQVALRDLAGVEPDVWLDVPERVHSLAPLGPGRLAAASERFVNFWDLDGGSRRGRVVAVLGAAPAQDIAPSPA
jgi:hypothetical protein